MNCSVLTVELLVLRLRCVGALPVETAHMVLHLSHCSRLHYQVVLGDLLIKLVVLKLDLKYRTE